MSALPVHQHDDTHPIEETHQPHFVTPEPDIAYMGGSAEDIDRLHPFALIGAILAGIAMWGLIIAGLVTIF